MTAHEKKQELRREMLKKRASLLPEYIKNTESETVPIIMDLLKTAAASAAEHSAPQRGAGAHAPDDRAPGARMFTVMSYMSYKNEFPTHELNKKILEAGYRLVLPFTDSDFSIIPCIIDSYDDLVISKLGIPEPVPAQCAVAALDDIDVILMPGVAFDTAGNRIGFGKGCYDRFIASGSAQRADKNEKENENGNINKNTGTCIPLLAALAYDFQIVDKIPPEPTDIPCNAIITEKRTLILFYRPVETVTGLIDHK